MASSPEAHPRRLHEAFGVWRAHAVQRWVDHGERYRASRDFVAAVPTSVQRAVMDLHARRQLGASSYKLRGAVVASQKRSEDG